MAKIMADNEQSTLNDASETKHQHVVEKSTEPGVINDELLKNLIRSHGPSGEAARLCRNVAIDYGTITELCLAFQNLLKIDHIWMCFNLTKLSLKCNKLAKIENLDNLKELRELDLSFNFIKTIENVNGLHKLEYLTLFQNDIRKIENLNELDQLIRLNLGNNFIETVDGIPSLRHRTKLFSLNLSGNPICGDIDFRLFVAAHLPNIKYYNYCVITDAERDEGRQIYKNKLRMLEETESEQLTEKQKHLNENEQLRLATASFVENLDKHQLFEAVFSNDTDTDSLHMDHTTRMSIKYRNRIYAVTQEIYLLGIQCYEQRSNEVKQFDEALANSCRAAQMKGIQLIDKFLIEKFKSIAVTKDNFHQINELVRNSNALGANLSDQRQSIDAISENFMSAINGIWYELMELETALHERINESMIIFNDTIRGIIENFIAQSIERFDCIRSACVDYFQLNFNDDADDNNKFGSVAMTATESSPMNQINIINRRMDTLCSRAKKWLSEVMTQYEQTEYNRNRMKVLEISNFIDAER